MAVPVSNITVVWDIVNSPAIKAAEIRSRLVGNNAWTEQAANADPNAGTFTFTANAPNSDVEVQLRYRMVTGAVSPWIDMVTHTSTAIVQYATVAGTPTSLSQVNSIEGGKLTGIAPGADVTGANTARDVANVNGIAAPTLTSNIATNTANITTLTANLQNVSGTVFDNTPPDVPTNLALTSTVAADSLGNQIVTLKATWSPSTAADTAGYVLAISTNGGGFVDEVVGNVTIWTDTIPANTSVSAKIAAYDRNTNKSGYSSVVSTTTTRDTVAPAIATNVTAATRGIGSITVSWTNPSDSDLATAQVWEASSNNSGSATLVATVNARPSQTSSEVTSHASGSTWFYWVKTVDGSGNASPFSAGASATVAAVIGTDITPASILNSAFASANLANLPSTAPIQNSLVTIDASGNLQGIGNGAGSSVANASISIQNGALTGIGSGAGTVVSNNLITMLANGSLSGGGGGAVTIGGLGYTGDLNATRGAPTGTIVGGVEAGALTTSVSTVQTVQQQTITTSLTPIGQYSRVVGNSVAKYSPGTHGAWEGGAVGTPFKNSGSISSAIVGVTVGGGWSHGLSFGTEGVGFAPVSEVAVLNHSAQGGGGIIIYLNVGGNITSANVSGLTQASRIMLSYDGTRFFASVDGVEYLSTATTAGQRLFPKVLNFYYDGTYAPGGIVGVTDVQIKGVPDNSLINADPAARINAFTTTISGGKITTGSISAQQIAANAITADRLVVGSFKTNMVYNGNLETGNTNGWAYAEGSNLGIAASTAVANTGNYSLRINNPGAGNYSAYGCRAMPVTPGKTYSWKYSVRDGSGSGGNLLLFRIEYLNSLPVGGFVSSAQGGRTNAVEIGGYVTQPSFQTYTGTWTCPANAVYASLVAYNYPPGISSTYAGSDLYFDDIEFYEQVSSTIIADGSISTSKIQAQAITATQIAASTITGNLIAANTIIGNNIAAGTLTALQIAANSITGDRLSANTVTAAQIAANTITAAQIAANSISGDRISTSTSLPGTITVGNTGVTIATTQAQAANSSNITLYDASNGNQYSIAGSMVTKLPPSGWYANAYSREGYTSGATIQGFLPDGSFQSFLGMTDARIYNNNNDYTTIPYAWYRDSNGWWIYEYGTPTYGPANFAPTSVVKIVYDGRTVTYFVDSTVVRTINTVSGRTFWAALSVNQVGGYVKVSSFTANTDNSLNNADPANTINYKSTQIDPGRVLISGATSLANWRNGGDNTKIEGGSIAANTITANKLTIGSRGITVQDCVFQANPANNTVTWGSGAVSYIDDSGAQATIGIAAGSAQQNGNYLYISWTKGATSLTVTTGIVTGDNIVFAIYTGGAGLLVNYGRTIIDGANITTGSITADRMNVNALSALTANLGQVRAGQILSNDATTNLSLDSNSFIFNASNFQIHVPGVSISPPFSFQNGALTLTNVVINGGSINNATINTSQMADNSISRTVLVTMSGQTLTGNGYSGATSGNGGGGQGGGGGGGGGTSIP